MCKRLLDTEKVCVARRVASNGHSFRAVCRLIRKDGAPNARRLLKIFFTLTGFCGVLVRNKRGLFAEIVPKFYLCTTPQGRDD